MRFGGIYRGPSLTRSPPPSTTTLHVQGYLAYETATHPRTTIKKPPPPLGRP